MSPLELFREGPEGLLIFCLLGASLVLAIALHEYAHALAADLQGDRLPRAMGRLTLNPVRHLDPLGTLCLVVAGFGWGKPVEFRVEALSSKRFGAAIVALAGPSMNVLLAVLGALLFRGAYTSFDHEVVLDFLRLFIVINLFLALFNLIPVPPLDGSRLLTIFLPPRHQKIIFFLDRYGILILLGIVFLASWVLDPIAQLVFDIAESLTGTPF